MQHGKGLRERTVAGVAWTTGAQVARQLIGLLVSAILSRLLTPREFGLVAMVMVLTNFLNALRDMGLSSALIQKQDVEHRHVNAVFWLNCAFGVGLTSLIAALAPLLASFYDEPSLQPLAVGLSLNFLVGSFGMAHRAMLTRQLDFSKVVAAEFVAAVLGDVVACVLAFRGFGAWSLVAQSLVSMVIGTVAVWRLSSFRPTLTFERKALDGMLGYGANLVGFTSLNYWTRNLDNVLIGHSAGPISLGLYTRAYSLMLLPVTQITQVLGRVVFATLSHVQADKQRTRSIYLATTRAIALVAFPAMIGLFVVAEPVITVLYGENWQGVVPILRVLCIAGVGQSIGSTVGWLYAAQGRTDLQFRWGIASSAIMAVAFFVGVRWGVLGVAWAYVLVGYTILWYPAWRIPFALVDLKFSTVLLNLSGVFACALAMGACVWLLQAYLPVSFHPAVRLGVLASAGAVTFAGLCQVFRVRAWFEVVDILKQRVARKSAKP
jgi:O-antigen/teichoic acid export membrane protein